MKKLLEVLLVLIILTGCTSREDYYELGIDDYSIVVGYDNSEYMDVVFDYDITNELSENEIIDDVDISLNGDFFGVGQFSNPKKKVIESKDAILTKLTIYLNDLNGRTFKINKEELDSSIKNNCDKYGGTYIEKNGYACVIENEVDDDLNVIELYGDYLNIDQDVLDHIVIYAK